jgi:2-(1,2-epoxy-1,2-dihydrophenyl)acetyl-CoA isomerase
MTIRIDRHDTVTLLTINRPEVRNAVDDVTMDALREAVVACADDGTRCIIITGAGGSFSSGADLKKAVAEQYTPDDSYRILTEHYAPALKAIRACPLPVIAAVDGYAAGIGCDLALTCDFRLVSERARFAELFVRIGLIPDGGGTYLLPRLVGTGRALEMIFTGADVDAQEAYRIGLANHVYPSETFLAEALAFAARISQQSPQALRLAKQALLASLDSTYDQALAQEAEHQRTILKSEDGMEGFLSFVQKRPPVWKGR